MSCTNSCSRLLPIRVLLSSCLLQKSFLNTSTLIVSTSSLPQSPYSPCHLDSTPSNALRLIQRSHQCCHTTVFSPFLFYVFLLQWLCWLLPISWNTFFNQFLWYHFLAALGKFLFLLPGKGLGLILEGSGLDTQPIPVHTIGTMACMAGEHWTLGHSHLGTQYCGTEV